MVVAAPVQFPFQPALQRQSVPDGAAVSIVCMLAGQLEHAAEPTVALNFPRVHATHGNPVKPFPHTHDAAAVLPTAVVLLFAGQAVQFWFPMGVGL